MHESNLVQRLHEQDAPVERRRGHVSGAGSVPRHVQGALRGLPRQRDADGHRRQRGDRAVRQHDVHAEHQRQSTQRELLESGAAYFSRQGWVHPVEFV